MNSFAHYMFIICLALSLHNNHKRTQVISKAKNLQYYKANGALRPWTVAYLGYVLIRHCLFCCIL